MRARWILAATLCGCAGGTSLEESLRSGSASGFDVVLITLDTTRADHIGSYGYAAGETLDNEALIDEKYAGIRPAPGYPACPEHSEKATLFRLLDAGSNAGMTLTESFAMLPTAAVSGYYFSHPQSQYFVVGRVSKEQAEDYARRKGVSLAQVERWLASNLDYDPE